MAVAYYYFPESSNKSAYMCTYIWSAILVSYWALMHVFYYYNRQHLFDLVHIVWDRSVLGLVQPYHKMLPSNPITLTVWVRSGPTQYLKQRPIKVIYKSLIGLLLKTIFSNLISNNFLFICHRPYKVVVDVFFYFIYYYYYYYYFVFAIE